MRKRRATATHCRSLPCRPGDGGEQFHNLDAIVRDYIQRHRPRGQREFEFYRDQQTLQDAISKAVFARTSSGRKHPHQWRIRDAILEEARRKLLATPLRESRSFSELHTAIEGSIRGITGVGELVVYDTALRIGAYLGLEPDLVYLHAGTRVGAKTLGLRYQQRFLRTTELPQPLLKLVPREIEDCLCIYKDLFPVNLVAAPRKT
jgi:hypothetical protein